MKHAMRSMRRFWRPSRHVSLDLIVLAGFLVKIPAAMIEAYRNKIINIHPSLIPSFCGVGYYGLKVHEAALARGVKVTGATVHYVDEGTDTGPILFQKAVEVQPDDTPKMLQQRVMEQAEWVHASAGDQCDCQTARLIDKEEEHESFDRWQRRTRACDRMEGSSESEGR